MYTGSKKLESFLLWVRGIAGNPTHPVWDLFEEGGPDGWIKREQCIHRMAGESKQAVARCHRVSSEIAQLRATGLPEDTKGRPYIYRARSQGSGFTYVGSSMQGSQAPLTRLLAHAAKDQGFGGLWRVMESRTLNPETDLRVEIVEVLPMWSTRQDVTQAEQRWIDHGADAYGRHKMLNQSRAG